MNSIHMYDCGQFIYERYNSAFIFAGVHLFAVVLEKLRKYAGFVGDGGYIKYDATEYPEEGRKAGGEERASRVEEVAEDKNEVEARDDAAGGEGREAQANVGIVAEVPRPV